MTAFEHRRAVAEWFNLMLAFSLPERRSEQKRTPPKRAESQKEGKERNEVQARFAARRTLKASTGVATSEPMAATASSSPIKPSGVQGVSASDTKK